MVTALGKMISHWGAHDELDQVIEHTWQTKKKILCEKTFWIGKGTVILHL